MSVSQLFTNALLVDGSGAPAVTDAALRVERGVITHVGTVRLMTSRHGQIRMKRSTSQVLRWCLAISIFTIMAVVGSLMTMALRQLRLPRIRPGLSVWMISSARWQQATPAM